ncbi:MAG: hypothetical protein EOP84_03150 [Verrucomicrobiaceae bacterium]|nr:MAG: hypothetical protein EOP84_03150 [Verrucomicrobiaceae bacterium]
MKTGTQSALPVVVSRLVRPLGHTGGSDYGRAVMDRNAAEELAREAYKNGDMNLRDEMLVDYRAAKERVKILQPNVRCGGTAAQDS